jgi:hypothetical protein
MAFDLGDPIPLSFTTRDATGALAAVTTAVLTITLPDATSVTPAVAAVTTGTYAPTSPWISTQAGMHRVSWVGSGTNAQTFTDTFNVLPADPRLLISLDEARKGLVLAAGNAVKDDDLRTYIAAATPIMEDIVGPILRTTRTESYDGGGMQICLLWAPIISIASIIESYGGSYFRTLNAQDVFSAGSTDPFGYSVDLTTGTITRRAAGVATHFASGLRNVQVTYVSGRAAVTGNLLLATRRLIRHLWEQDHRAFRQQHATTEVVLTPMGFAVPRAVIEMCADSSRPPGLA